MTGIGSDLLFFINDFFHKASNLLELNLFAIPGTEGKFSFLHLFVAPFSDIFFAWKYLPDNPTRIEGRRFGVKVRLRDLTNIEAVREAIDDVAECPCRYRFNASVHITCSLKC